MKIGIDISQIIYGTGVSVYTENLVKNLLEADKANEYVLFGGSLRRIGDLKLKTKDLKATKKFYPIPPTLANFIWNKLHILPIEWLVGKVDVFHSSDWTQPPSNAFKVTTVHDLSPFKFPEFTNPNIVFAHEARLMWVKKEVDRVIVPSNATKMDLVDLGFKEKKIRVIPEAPDAEFKPASSDEIARVKRKYSPIRPYILAIGVGGRKNTDNLIGAFENVRAKEELDLVLVGAGTSSLEQTRGVKVLRHITNPDLSALYSGAEVLVYPSLYEGFGLPILQAFTCKCPVVTSNISSMPEVAGSAAVLVDPYSVDSITDGIKMALRHRKLYIGRGLVHVQRYSWEKTARETLKVYNEARKP